MGRAVGLAVVGAAVGAAVVGAGEGAGVSHVPSALHRPLTQSRAPSAHAAPGPHAGHAPPPQSTAVSSAFFIPSEHDAGVGCAVGWAVGNAVGLDVGAAVGAAVGLRHTLSPRARHAGSVAVALDPGKNWISSKPSPHEPPPPPQPNIRVR